MEGSIQKRIEWIEKRTPLSDMAKHYIAFQMQLYAEDYHEQQVKKFDLADVGGNEVACNHNFNRVSDCQIKCDKCGEDYEA